MEAGIKALSVIAHEIGMCDAVCTEGDLAPELRQVVVAGDLDPAQGKDLVATARKTGVRGAGTDKTRCGETGAGLRTSATRRDRHGRHRVLAC